MTTRALVGEEGFSVWGCVLCARWVVWPWVWRALARDNRWVVWLWVWRALARANGEPPVAWRAVAHALMLALFSPAACRQPGKL